ncbi:MAG: septal ring lytic transglycosylase RlpA family protein [Pseudomonadota bacterium]
MIARAALACGAFALAACGSAPKRAPETVARPAAATQPAGEAPTLPAAGSGKGGYYLDDGPEDHPPPGLKDVPDAQVKAEPYSRRANRPYVVFGKTYTPITDDQPYTQRGVASWYGKKFHGQRTSSGELYDMYKMTAAHPTLPIPSYARLTSVVSGKSVVVRINDRGPFHSDRIIDVSYTAALKLDLLGKGSHEIILERVLPGQEPPKAPAAAPADVAALMLDDKAPAAPPPATGNFYLQLGAFARADKAEEVRARLEQLGGPFVTARVEQTGGLHRVYCGPFETRTQAGEAAQDLPSGAFGKALVVRRQAATLEPGGGEK